MKKVLISIFLFFIGLGLAKADNVEIESIEFVEKSTYTEELEEAKVKGLSINVNVKFIEINDYIKYKIIINNKTTKDYELTNRFSEYNTDNIEYNIEYKDNNILKANSKKEAIVEIKYTKEVEANNLVDGKYIENKEVKINMLSEEPKKPLDTIIETVSKKIENPNTTDLIIVTAVVLIISLVMVLILRKNISKKYISILLIMLISIPCIIYALEELLLTINTKVEVEPKDTIKEQLINNYPDNFVKYDHLVTDEVGKTVQATNVYFATSQITNNVLFGNFCWQIVRTTEIGGLKMIYNGLPVNGTCPAGRNYEDRIIGKSKYNDKNNSPAYSGYMYNTVYTRNTENVPNSGTRIYGNDVKYENGEYTLLDTSTSKDNTHHYTCNTADGGSVCETVLYYYYGNYNLVLSNGKTIDDAMNEMFYADDVNKTDSTMKTYIENWYENNLLDYSDLLDNNVYCNDRSLANKDTNGWNKNGNFNTSLAFRNNIEGAELDCPNITDQFSISNEKAQLKYPIALITEPERYWGGNDLFKIDTWYWGMSPIFFRYDNLAYASYVLDNGNFNSGYFYSDDNVAANTSFINVRPVITLHKYVVIKSGDGSANNPFTIAKE